jgi:hypothetical protein
MLTSVATLVLALGIGTNTAILAVLDGALFRPPPGIHEADALVNIRSVPVEATTTATGFFNDELTYTEFLPLREDAAALFEVAARTASWSPDGAIALRTNEGLEQVFAELVSSAYFRVLRTPVVLGFTLQPGDDRPGNPVLLARSDPRPPSRQDSRKHTARQVDCRFAVAFEPDFTNEQGAPRVR